MKFYGMTCQGYACASLWLYLGLSGHQSIRWLGRRPWPPGPPSSYTYLVEIQGLRSPIDPFACGIKQRRLNIEQGSEKNMAHW